MSLRVDKNPAWASLAQQAERFASAYDLRQAFLTEPGRFADLSLSAPYLRADLSRNSWNQAVRQQLLDLAEAAGLPQRRAALLSGGVVNPTENRPALHAWLRAQATQAQGLQACENLAGLQDMLELAELLRADPEVDDLVHIGVGGSGLGPEMALQALQPFHDSRLRIHVVSNLDGHDLHQTLQGLDAARTVFVVASKSWSTAETLRNAASAQAWCRAAGVADPRSRFVAVTSRPELARQAGLGRVLHMPEGIGGRYSLWSAVGLPLAVAVGPQRFRDLLRGAAEIDAHFAQAPLRDNLPVNLGLLDLWNATFLRLENRCLVPYHHGLRRLPAYLQQLEMESNGKRVRLDGSPLDYPTSPVLWGEVGSNSQHAFFQCLHQGTPRIATEFVLVRKPSHDLDGHHEALLANGLAQAQALMQGASAGEGQLPGHQDFPGNRPSTLLLLEDLSPASLGALLALYEHRVFVAGCLWGINSFDQWGVELGKTLARDLQRRMATRDLDGLDPATAGVMEWLL
jgi:glucose-6-phosphate isomerase